MENIDFSGKTVGRANGIGGASISSSSSHINQQFAKPMGITDFFSQIVPMICDDTAFTKSLPAVELWDGVMVDVTGVVFWLQRGSPLDFAKSMLQYLPSKAKHYFIVSDNDERKLSEKDLTRASRTRAQRYDVPFVRFEHEGAVDEDGSIVETEFECSRLMSDRVSRAALLDYLARTLKNQGAWPKDAQVDIRMNHDSTEAEADMALFNFALEQKLVGDVVVVSGDSDVAMLLLLACHHNLVAGTLRIYMNRGPHGIFELHRFAQSLVSTRKISIPAFFLLCVCAGNDFVMKRWMSDRVSVKTMTARLLAEASKFTELKLTPETYRAELEKFLSVVCPQSKHVDWDKCEQGDGSKSQRAGAEMQVVPWTQLKFILDYWYLAP